MNAGWFLKNGVQALVELPREFVHVGARDVHRRRDADHVAVESRPCRSAGGSRAPPPSAAAVAAAAGSFVSRSSHQFDRLHQAHAAHVADQRVLLLQLLQALRAGTPRLRRRSTSRFSSSMKSMHGLAPPWWSPGCRRRWRWSAPCTQSATSGVATVSADGQRRCRGPWRCVMMSGSTP